MIVRTITVYVKPGMFDAFESATRENHYGSVAEAGVIRFDVMRDEQTPGRYLLYEIYESPEAALLHKETAHYARWRDTVEPMMALPRERSDWTLLYPESTG